MIKIDRSTDEVTIGGSEKEIALEVALAMAVLLHDIVVPHGGNPLEYAAAITCDALTLASKDCIFEGGTYVELKMPKKIIEGGTDE